MCVQINKGGANNMEALRREVKTRLKGYENANVLLFN